jgi:hypothetical protein
MKPLITSDRPAVRFVKNAWIGRFLNRGLLTQAQIQIVKEPNNWRLTLYPHAEAVEFFKTLPRSADAKIELSCLFSEDEDWVLVRSPLGDGGTFRLREMRHRRPHLLLHLHGDGFSATRTRACSAQFFDEEQEGWMFKIT